MSATQNKNTLRAVFEELSKGNGKPFVELWADDFSWTITGNTKWSRTYRGKESVRKDLMAPLFSRFATQYTNTATRFIAEDDYVVVECRGNVTTKSGQPYNNTYCYVCRMEDGRLKELTEYLDTELVSKALGDPP
ncbi:MAG: nuclear transport factor 2 family protein [Nevskia sp.]|nr:nuclear transport factor 2 family protein [Nevskia sp.]